MQSEDSEHSSDQSVDLFNKLAPEQPKSNKKQDKKVTIERPKGINLNIIRQKHPRLVIDHMVLEDFKSYAGRQVIGKFHGNFTSVVGPNGSGKSNLIESMLFIFGFSASWMRLNKLCQLIHNSSTSTGVNKAAVQIHFKKMLEGSDGTMVDVPGSEFWIRRTVNSASVSKYYLLGKESTQAEVKERLKMQGIDLGNNRFLILQGEVEQISQMKQKSGDRQKPGLLQYLQDIIGSNQFIEKIQECGVEYAQAEQQKHEKGQLMKLVETQLKGMSKAKDEAVRYVKKEKKIFQLQNVFNQVLVYAAQQQGKKLKQKLVELQKTRDRIVIEERQKLKKQAERIKQIRRNKAEMEQVQKTLDRYQQTCNKLQIEDKHITQQVAFKSEDLVKFERKTQEYDRQFSKIINQCEQIRQNLPKNTEILKQRNHKLEQMRLELSKYQKPQLRQKIKDSEIQLSKNELETNTLKSKLQHLKQTVAKMKVGKGQLQTKIKEYQQKTLQNNEMREKIDKARVVAERVAKQRTDKVAEMNRKREDIKNEIRQLDNELRQNLNQSEEQGQVGNMYREIMAQRFPGVLGRLGDLGDVPREYDQIITTCCNKLDNIVVQDLETATAVLNYLKQKRIGRVTCIILDKISQYRNYMNRPFVVLPRSIRLFDAVKFKTQQAKLAFYFALNDTLYCEDSDLGLQYSMKNESQRRRVICKNKNRGGYIIYEMNGLMVGSAPKRGGFEHKAGIKKNKQGDEHRSKDLDNRKKQLIRNMEELNKKIGLQEAELKIATQDVQQMRRELVSIRQNIKEYEEEIKDLKVMVGKAEGKATSTDNMDKQIQAISNQLANLAKRRSEHEKILKQLEEEQKKNENSDIHQLRQKYKQEKAEVNRSQKQFQKQKALLESSIKRIDDIKNGKKDNERTLERLKRQIDKFKNDQLELERKVSQIIGKMTACEQKLKECKKNEQDLRMIMDEDDKEVRQSKTKVEKAKKDVENCQQNCKKQNQQLQLSQQELEKVRQNYRQLSASYSFLDHLQEVQKMAIGGGDKYNDDVLQPRNSSMLQTSMLNSSIDSNQPKALHIDEIFKQQPFANLNEDQLENYSFFKDKLSGMITAETAALKKMEGSNIEIINEYRAKYTHYRQRLAEFQAVKERQSELKRIIDTLKEERLRLFREGFGIINAKLKEVYQHLTRGGDAQLQLIDALDPFSDGVNFSVRPPKKSWKEVNKLSGGQKTLSSLSLIFALHYYKPTPLYFMDEIDAALDFKNVSIVADYIKKRTKDAQFIIISLRNNMFDLANKLIGVYKTNDKTKVINLQPAKILQQRQNKQRQNTQNRQNEANSNL